MAALLDRYGFNAGLTAPGNLSKGYDSMSQDFPTIVWRLKQLGFNAIRLPFSFSHFQVCSLCHKDTHLRRERRCMFSVVWTSWHGEALALENAARPWHAQAHACQGVLCVSCCPCRMPHMIILGIVARQATMLSGEACCP